MNSNLIWFQLSDDSGHAFRGTTADCVSSLSPAHVVAQFRDEVKKKFADSHLKGIAAANLKVYANKASFEAGKNPLGVAAQIGQLGAADEDPIWVVVPTTTNAPPVGTRPSFYVLIFFN